MPSDQLQPLDTGTEYYAFALSINRKGTQGCAGCAEPLCIVLNDVRLYPRPGGEVIPMNYPYQRNFVAWQSQLGDCPLSTATEASVIDTRAEPGSVRIVWNAGLVRQAIVERREGAGPWHQIATQMPDGDHRMTLEDRAVTEGATYGYRLGIGDGDAMRYVGETSVVVPAAAQLALGQTIWRPGKDAVSVSFTLPARARAMLELFDLTGRRLSRRSLDALDSGDHEVDLPAPGLASGVYFVRLTHGADQVSARLVAIR